MNYDSVAHCHRQFNRGTMPASSSILTLVFNDNERSLTLNRQTDSDTIS